ncbi:hypothetical protein, partial [Erwinia amylovora]|uniref:hypothetical protein n=1 Tax=Erwinia amylovora TaxID=552 RepID=UPI0019646E1F
SPSLRTMLNTADLPPYFPAAQRPLTPLAIYSSSLPINRYTELKFTEIAVSPPAKAMQDGSSMK